MTTSDKAAQPLTAEELAEMRLLLAETRRRQTILAEATRAQADDVDSHAKMIEFDAAAEAFDDMADQDGLVESIARLLATLDAQAAKPPTVQLDTEQLAEIVYNCPAGITQRQAGKIADALISALPGLTPAHPVTTGPDAEVGKLAQKLKALAAKAAKGEWGVEDPMAPETLSVVANPKAQVYDWMFICHLTMPDENDRDFTHAQVRDNAAYIAAANPDAIALLAREVLRLHAAPGAGWRDISSAPKTGDDLVEKCVLGYCKDDHPNDRYKVVWWEPKIKGGVWWSDQDLECTPIYWQPLPEPPAPASEGAA